LPTQEQTKRSEDSGGAATTTTAAVNPPVSLQTHFRPRNRFNFTRLTIVIFIFVFIRGPLFQVSDLTQLGWDRVSCWKVLNNLVRAGILEKFDRTSYAVTENAKGWFRSSFGGGANDPAFAYSALAAESWSKTRYDYFIAVFGRMWENRPKKASGDSSKVLPSPHPSDEKEEGDRSTLVRLLREKLEDAQILACLMEKRN
jgi:hypothetical protein